MIDINKNGKVDPEDEALADIVTDQIVGENKENKPLSLIAVVVALLVVLLIAAIIFLSK